MPIITNIFKALNQRYFLAMMCMWGVAMNTLNQLNFISMMTEVLYNGRDQGAYPTSEGQSTSVCTVMNQTISTSSIEEFIWGKIMQIHVLMGYQVGYALGRLPAGMIIDRVGVKTIYGFGVFIPGIMSLLTPICARTSPYVLVVNRLLCGFFSTVQTPAMAYLASRWFPRKDIGFMLALIYLGLPLGCIISFSIGHQLLFVFRKWVSMFYINGVLSVIWAYIWQAVVWDNPFDHPYMSQKELELLTKEIPMYANKTDVQPGSSWPWHAIFWSSALWSLTFANIGYTWYFYFATVILPSMYISEVHKINMNNHENLMVFMSITTGLAILAAGMVSDTLVRSRMFNVTHLTKGRFTLSNVVGSVLLISVTYSGCFFTTIFLHLIGVAFLMGIAFTCHIHACLNVSSKNVGVIVALTSIPSDVTSPLEVKLADELTPHGTIEEWRLVSYLYCLFITVSTVIFLKWGNCQPQSLNNLRGVQVRNTDVNMSDIPAVTAVQDVTNMKRQESAESLSKSDITSVKEPGAQSAAENISNSAEGQSAKSREVPPSPQGKLTASTSEIRNRVVDIKSARALHRLEKSQSKLPQQNNDTTDALSSKKFFLRRSK